MTARNEIIDKLSEGLRKFSYYKSDDSLREAYGTLNHDIIDRLAPSGTTRSAPRRKPSVDLVSYYDIVSRGWRSFRLDRFAGFDPDYGD